MIFNALKLNGAYLIEQEKRRDERGFFARTFCAHEFRKHGLKTEMVQSNTSWSEKIHTLRGMHFQKNEFAEAKLIRCTTGKILDVIIDIRPDSSSYLQHTAVELSAENGNLLYVPEGFAHGYLTLSAGTEVFYQVSSFYQPDSEGGIRWNDPLFNIQWPVLQPVISEKDKNHPDFQPK